MKIRLILLGKTEDDYLKEGTSIYIKRIQHYIPFEVYEIPLKHGKRMSPSEQKVREGQWIKTFLSPSDLVVLLDEHGREYGSVEFANWLQNKMNTSIKHLTFIVGGPHGISDEIKSMTNMHLSLSKMTFSHQMVRLFFLEQLYRAFTILRNEPYHNS